MKYYNFSYKITNIKVKHIILNYSVNNILYIIISIYISTINDINFAFQIEKN